MCRFVDSPLSWWGGAVHLGDTPRLGTGARAGVVDLGMVDGAGCGDGARFIWANVDRRSLLIWACPTLC
eukprot:m.436334 g.436334  ORF g.436334 m.436334 type:complete len:69 (+) comp105123_c0_seq1:139-345(+)